MGDKGLYKHKLVIIGDQGVGKTSILHRFVYDAFSSNYEATVGIDFLSKTLYLEDRTVRLQLWDTAGQEKFRSLIPGYIRQASGALVVYDITNRESFLSVDEWIKDIRSERGEEISIALVGNKVDMADKRVVTVEEGQNKAIELRTTFLESSAKSNQNIRTIFSEIAKSLRVESAIVQHGVELTKNVSAAEKREDYHTTRCGSC